MLRFLAVLLVVLTIPASILVLPVQSTERQPTMLDVDLEHFRHVTYPCHAFKMIRAAKIWEPPSETIHGLDRKTMTATLLAVSEKSLTKSDQMTAASIMRETGLDLRTMSQERRTVAYHLMLSTCIATHYGWDEDELKDEPLLKALSMMGWQQ